MRKLTLLFFFIFTLNSSAQVNTSFLISGVHSSTVLSINDSLIYTCDNKNFNFGRHGIAHYLLRYDNTVKDSISHFWVDSTGVYKASTGVFSHAVQVGTNSIIVGYSLDSTHNTFNRLKPVMSKLRLFPNLDTIKTKWLVDKNMVGCDNYFFSRIDLEDDTLIVATGFCEKTVGNYYNRYFVIEMDTNLNVIRDSLYDRPALNFSLQEYLRIPGGSRVWGGGRRDIPFSNSKAIGALTKLNSAMEVEWQRSYPTSVTNTRIFDGPMHLFPGTDNTHFFAIQKVGDSCGVDNPFCDSWGVWSHLRLLKFDWSGNVLDEYHYKQNFRGLLTYQMAYDAHSVVLAGVHTYRRRQGFVYRFNRYGDSLWFANPSALIPTYQQDELAFWNMHAVALNKDKILSAGSLYAPSFWPAKPPQNIYITVLDTNGLYLDGTAPTNSFSILEQELAAQIKVYPNPAREYVKVEWPDGLKLDRASIYDLTGRKVLQQRLEPSAMGKKEFTLNSLPPGTYLLHLEKDGVMVFAQKLVVE